MSAASTEVDSRTLDKSWDSEIIKEVRHCGLNVVSEESKVSVNPRSPGAHSEISRLSQPLPELPCNSITACRTTAAKTLSTVTSSSSSRPYNMEPCCSIRPSLLLSPQNIRLHSQPSSGLSRFLAKSSDNEGHRLRPLKIVSLFECIE